MLRTGVCRNHASSNIVLAFTSLDWYLHWPCKLDSISKKAHNSNPQVPLFPPAVFQPFPTSRICSPLLMSCSLLCMALLSKPARQECFEGSFLSARQNRASNEILFVASGPERCWVVSEFAVVSVGDQGIGFLLATRVRSTTRFRD